MTELSRLAAAVGARLTERGETLAVAESSTGGLISAALLAVPGASKFYVGGAVVYTARARLTLLDIPQKAMDGLRSASEPYAVLLARVAGKNLKATWGLSETGTATRRATAAPPWSGPTPRSVLPSRRAWTTARPTCGGSPSMLLPCCWTPWAESRLKEQRCTG